MQNLGQSGPPTRGRINSLNAKFELTIFLQTVATASLESNAIAEIGV
jgi:hypothetical protein